jgi:hypothetical protein
VQNESRGSMTSGNLPALRPCSRRFISQVDHIIVGGDVLPGPMPRETLERLLELNIPVRFIHGNGNSPHWRNSIDRSNDRLTGAPRRVTRCRGTAEIVRWSAAQVFPSSVRGSPVGRTIQVDVRDWQRRVLPRHTAGKSSASRAQHPSTY